MQKTGTQARPVFSSGIFENLLMWGCGDGGDRNSGSLFQQQAL